MKNLTILIGILFVYQMAFSQTTGKLIFHDDFDNNDNGWQNCQIINGNIVTTKAAILPKAITFPEDFILTTKVASTTNNSDYLFWFYNYQYRAIKNPNNNYSNFKFCGNGGYNTYFDNEKNNPKINVNSPILVKITCINKLLSFYANDILLYTTTLSGQISTRTIFYDGYESTTAGYPSRITSADYLYIDELVISPEERQRRDDIIESDFYTNVKSSKNYDSYLTKYPNGKYYNEIFLLKEVYFYNIAIGGFVAECDNYLSKYPTGKYITQVQEMKAERILYKSALNGSFKEYDAYILKYPNGKYTSEISSLKAKELYEIDRQKRIKANSNKALWKTGNKICFESSSGTICGTLMSWNEDKSMIQFKVISGPNTRIEGEQIKPDALIWITPNSDWHICLQDEIDASITQNEDPFKYWKLGKKICLSGTKGAWIFKSSVTITGEIIQWNEDKSKVRIRIIDGADGTYYNNETLYNDKIIWDSPSGWKLCN